MARPTNVLRPAKNPQQARRREQRLGCSNRNQGQDGAPDSQEGYSGLHRTEHCRGFYSILQGTHNSSFQHTNVDIAISPEYVAIRFSGSHIRCKNRHSEKTSLNSSVPVFLLFGQHGIATHHRARREARRLFHKTTQATDIQISDWTEQLADSHPRYRVQAQQPKRLPLNLTSGFYPSFISPPKLKASLFLHVPSVGQFAEFSTHQCLLRFSEGIVKRRVSILLFLCFYFSASMVATHHRARREARRLFHKTTQATDIQISDWTEQLADSHPRYREAKKVAVEFDFRVLPIVHLAPQVESFKFAEFLLYWEAHHVPNSPVTRAPPFQV